MGDSLSAAFGIKEEQGWVSLLQQKLSKQGYSHRVINASISGETTSGGLTRIKQQLSRHQPSIVIIALGANDGLRGLSLKAMRKNLGLMIELSKKMADVQLIGVRLPPNFGPFVNQRFHRVFEDLAQEQHITLTPYLLKGFENDRRLFQADGLHPTAEAQTIILDTVQEDLERLLKKTPDTKKP